MVKGLTPEEALLVLVWRSLSEEGKDFLTNTLEMVQLFEKNGGKYSGDAETGRRKKWKKKKTSSSLKT